MRKRRRKQTERQREQFRILERHAGVTPSLFDVEITENTLGEYYDYVSFSNVTVGTAFDKLTNDAIDNLMQDIANNFAKELNELFASGA